MGRDRRRNEDDLLEAKGFPNLLRAPEMPQMDGIKGSSKKTHSLLPSLLILSPFP